LDFDGAPQSLDPAEARHSTVCARHTPSIRLERIAAFLELPPFLTPYASHLRP
jgi:hypothetical protein